MRSAPTTSLDLGDPSLVADPYAALAAERARHAVAWHEPTGRWMTFTHATVSAVLRERTLGRLWSDKEPADVMEPFNLLHRNQMMENEPPDHARLRRPVASAFARGHVERLRPRVVEIATSLLAEVDPAGFDVLGEYAEPLPVLVIAELLGVPTSWAPQLRAWSQAIVRMYETSPSAAVVSDAVSAAADFAALLREIADDRRRSPRDDLVSDLVATSLSPDEVVASAVLLLNAGHEASVNAFGNGLVTMLRQGVSAAGAPVEGLVEEMLRVDAPLQLFERTATAPVEVGGVTIEEGEVVCALLGAANRDPAVFADPDTFDPARSPNPHLAFGAGLHFCLGSPLARMELVESVGALLATYPFLRLDGEPEHRGTFVLRGYERVRVAADA